MGTCHHKICQFIYDNNALFHGPLPILLAVKIIAVNILNARLGKEFIAVQHFRHRLVECLRRFFRICNHRPDEIRNAIIHFHLHDFRVHHYKFQLAWRSMIQIAHDNAVDADALSSACCSRNEKMRHFCQISINVFSGNIFSHRKGQLALVIFKLIRIQHFTDGHCGFLIVWHLDSNGRFAWNRRFDANAGSRHIKGNIVGEVDNFAHLYPSGRLKLIARYRRPLACMDDLCIDMKALERLFQDSRFILRFVSAPAR